MKKWYDQDMEKLQKWREEKDQAAGDDLIRRYMSLVDYVVNRMSITLPQTVHKDDLQSLGWQGLLDAFEKFDPQRGIKFETYATFRIKGAIIDGLRKNDWLPRSIRDKVKKIEEAYQVLEQQHLRSVTDEEVSAYVGLSPNEVNKVLVEASLSSMLSIDEPILDEENQQVGRYNVLHNEEAPSPDQLLNDQLVKDHLAEAIRVLPEKEKLVITLVYYEELTLTEIAHILNLSTSRISQLHSKAVLRLKSVLSKDDFVQMS